ncbi:hypothetical protein B1no1_19310 [Thermolongibacillus altinsuensis]|nr:hypothetical protein B1no1_19310 [Thermolongibacillus altinsuensis]
MERLFPRRFFISQKLTYLKEQKKLQKSVGQTANGFVYISEDRSKGGE